MIPKITSSQLQCPLIQRSKLSFITVAIKPVTINGYQINPNIEKKKDQSKCN